MTGERGVDEGQGVIIPSLASHDPLHSSEHTPVSVGNGILSPLPSGKGRAMHTLMASYLGQPVLLVSGPL